MLRQRGDYVKNTNFKVNCCFFSEIRNIAWRGKLVWQVNTIQKTWYFLTINLMQWCTTRRYKTKSMIQLQFLYYHTSCNIFTPAVVVFTGVWVKFPLFSSTLLCILATLNNAVIWMVSIHPPISSSSSLLSKPFLNYN